MTLRQVYWEDVSVGQEIPGYSLEISPTRIALQVSGSQDFYAVQIEIGFIETRRPEEHNGWNAEGRSDMSCTRIIADHE